jgi:peptidoglycan hydrolase CwlO-like protein
MQCIYLGVHSPLPVLDDALPLPEDLPLQEEDGTETVLEPLVAESPLSVLERTSEPRGEERPSPRGVTAGRELTIDNGQQEIDDLEDKLDNVNSTIATVHHRISLLKKQVCELEPQRDRIRRKIRKLNK